MSRDAIEVGECLVLSAADSAKVLDLLENPPQSNARLVRAADALPDFPCNSGAAEED